MYFDDCDLSNYIGNELSYYIPYVLPKCLFTPNKLLTSIFYKEEINYLVYLIQEQVHNKGVYILNYDGVQYGSYRTLGDGRSAYIGRLIYKGESYDICLKGIGVTKYSRGNGLCSYDEYIADLNNCNWLLSKEINTTILMGAWIFENKAIYLTLSKSVIRIGTVQFLSKKGNKYIDLCCKYYTSYVLQSDEIITKEDLFVQVLNTYKNVYKIWNTHKFCHGRLNTDNVLLCGWVHDSSNNLITNNNMYSFNNQKYAIALCMEYLAIALNIPEVNYLNLINSVFINEITK